MYRQKNGTDPVERLDSVLRDRTRYKKVRGARPASIVRQSSQVGKRLRELRENAPVRDRKSEEQRSEELRTRSGSRYEEKRSEAAVKTGSRYEDKKKAETAAKARHSEVKKAVAVPKAENREEQKQEATARPLPAPVAKILTALSGLNRRNAAMIASIAVAAALVVGYAVVGVFYTSHFYDGTTIFGIDCSRYTAERAREEVADKVSMYTLTVDSRTGSDVISAGEIGLRYRDSGTIERLLKTQKSFLWPVMMSMRRNTVITVDTDYDVPKMDRELEAFSCYKRVNEIMPQDAYLGRNDDGFVVVPEQPGSKLDREAVRRKVMGALDTGETYLSLDETGCYLEPAVTSDDPELNRQAQARNVLLGADLTYTFGDETREVDASVIMNFIVPDGEGGYQISEERVWDYVSSLAYRYDTYGKPRQFHSSIGTIEYLEGGDYGWLMDQAETAQQLLDAIRSKQTGPIEPVWSVMGKAHGLNDIGGTYVEVCISMQEMWCYQNGTLIVDTPVVTGNPNMNNATPSGGVWAIDAKMTDFTLTGPDYRVPVNYWMPFNGNVGIHDLQSRYYYGGSIYLYGGSHGCVNTPLDAVSEIYNAVSVGTPVIVYE